MASSNYDLPLDQIIKINRKTSLKPVRRNLKSNSKKLRSNDFNQKPNATIKLNRNYQRNNIDRNKNKRGGGRGAGKNGFGISKKDNSIRKMKNLPLSAYKENKFKISISRRSLNRPIVKGQQRNSRNSNSIHRQETIRQSRNNKTTGTGATVGTVNNNYRKSGSEVRLFTKHFDARSKIQSKKQPRKENAVSSRRQGLAKVLLLVMWSSIIYFISIIVYSYGHYLL